MWVDVDDVMALAERKAAGELTNDEAVALIVRLAGQPSTPSPSAAGAAGDAIARIRMLVAAGELTKVEGDAVIADLRSLP